MEAPFLPPRYQALYCRWGTKVGGASRKEEEEEKGGD